MDSIDHKLIEEAKRVNLPQYLISRGEPLRKSGNRFYHIVHDSLVFTYIPPYWSFYWNSKNMHGDSISFLRYYFDMDFKTALKELTGVNVVSFIGGEVSDKNLLFDFNNIRIAKDAKRAIAYLHKTRGIDYDLILNFVKDKLILQEEETGNIIFPIIDEFDKCVGAEVRGTASDVKFTGLKPNSKYGYGYCMKYGSSPKYILFFESAVDLLSFIEIEEIKGKDLRSMKCVLVSMAGLKANVFKNMYNVFKSDFEPLEAFLCVDNDVGGNNFITHLKNDKKWVKNDNFIIKVCQPDERFKDWNEQLKYLKKA